MHTTIRLGFGILFLFAAGGCGGGGGSGSGGGSSASTGVRILHAAIDAPPLEVVSSARDGVVDTARFGEVSLYGGLGLGTQTLVVRPVLESTRTVGSFEVTVSQNERRSIVVYGTEEGGLRNAILDDAPGTIPNDKAVVRVVNGLAGASDIAVTITGAEAGLDLDPGSGSFHQPVDPGAQTITVRSPSRTVFSGARVFEVGKAYTVLVAGEDGYFITVTMFED